MPEKTLRISIPSPCGQSWEVMPEAGAGRYCGQCSKVIIDFTKLSDEELIRIFTNKQSSQLCGTFSREQLEKTYVLRAPVRNPSYAGLKLMLAGLLSFPLLNTAQNTTAPGSQVHKAQFKKTPVQQQRIKGKVIDRTNKKGIAAEIRLYANRLDAVEHSTFSADSNGYYELILPREGLSRFFKLLYSSGTYQERAVIVDLHNMQQWLAVSLIPEIVVPAEPKKDAIDLETIEIQAKVNKTYTDMGIPYSNIKYVRSRWHKRVWYRFKKLFRYR